MKLTPINPPLNGNVGVICIGCDAKIFVGGFANLHGVPFRSYYCDRCAEEVPSLVRFSNAGECAECQEVIEEGQDASTFCGSVHEWCEDTHRKHCAQCGEE